MTPAPLTAEALDAAATKALAEELFTYADQLTRMETQAGFGGKDLSVRVKEPGWLAALMRRAGSALQARRLAAAKAALASATAELARLRAEGEAKDRALKDERAQRKAAVQSVREKAAALCDEAAAYFDRTTGHYDRSQAAGGYRATASKIRLLTPDRTALARAATAREG